MGKGQPGIRQLKPSRRFPKGGWEVRYRDPENATRRRTFNTLQDARDFQRAVHTDMKRGDWLDPRLALTSFREVAEDWFETTANLKRKTRHGYRHTLDKYLLPAFGSRPIGRIKPSDVRRFIAELPDRLSPTSRRGIVRALVPIFDQALEDGQLRTNPMRARSVRKATPQIDGQEMLFISKEQVEALALAMAPPHDLIVRTAFWTGMRAGEIAALRVRSLDLLRRRISVEEAVSDVGGHLTVGPPKNKTSRRSFPIPAGLAEQLASHLAARNYGPEDFVFGSRRGQPLRINNWRRNHFKPAVRRMLPEGLHGLRLHDLRHSHVAHLISIGVPIKAIAERLGHANPTVTMSTYAHVLPGVMETFVKRLDTDWDEVATTPTPEPSAAMPFGG